MEVNYVVGHSIQAFTTQPTIQKCIYFLNWNSYFFLIHVHAILKVSCFTMYIKWVFEDTTVYAIVMH